MDAVAGIDIGGTGVRAALVGTDGSVGTPIRKPLADRRVPSVVRAVREAVAELGPVERVGVGVPGFVQRGRVLASPNFPQWRDVPLDEHLQRDLGVTVTIENDANCAAFGAWTQRGRKGDLVLLTLGTGVGGGVVTGGRLLRGAGGTGAELGHIYAGGDAKCGCGGVGCLESWVGTWGLARLASERGHTIQDGEELVRMAEGGNAWAVEVLHLAAQALGRGLVTLVNLFNPDVVVLTGGLAAARDHIGPIATEWLVRYGIEPSVKRAALEWGGRAENYAIAGAAACARGDDG